MNTFLIPSNVLERITATGELLAEPDDDVRGRKVVDRFGKSVGMVVDLFVDQDEHFVRFLQVDADRFLGVGARRFVIPVGAIKRVSKHKVHVNVTLGHILNSPVYDAERLHASGVTAWSPYYGYYALPSHWEPNYAYPALRHVDSDP